ncbi:MAG: CcmD family protein [Thermoflexibacter sp.]|nr:CcmD family protein [Thermoflexibacter sp.]
MKKYILLFCFFVFSFFVNAQQTDKIKIEEKDYANQEIEMADKFREDGKIYVVLAVVLTILSGIIIYLVVLDKKISLLEKQVKN